MKSDAPPNDASRRATRAGASRRARVSGPRFGGPLLAAIAGVGALGGLGWMALDRLAVADGYMIVQARVADGRLHPVQHAGGRITQVHAVVGQSVAAGELLATVDTGDVDARITELKAQAQASQLRLDVVRREVQAFEVMEQQQLVARARVEELERKLAALERENAGVLARVAEADGYLALVEIRAPIGGVVHSIDGLVAGRDVRPGEKLAEIAGHPAGVILEAMLTAKQAGAVSAGRDVRIWPELAAWRDGRGFAGRLLSLRLEPAPSSIPSGGFSRHIARVEVEAREAAALSAVIAPLGGKARIAIRTGAQPAVQQFFETFTGMAAGHSSFRFSKGA